MSLTGVVGTSKRAINRYLLHYAAKHHPALIIDCANAANPHALYPQFPVETLKEVYVIELELLYKFRDVLLHLNTLATHPESLRCIVVTTSDHLFNYQDQNENFNIITHVWELLKEQSRTRTILVGVTTRSVYHPFAQKYCDTLWDIPYTASA